jgi:hypothetical protein
LLVVAFLLAGCADTSDSDPAPAERTQATAQPESTQVAPDTVLAMGRFADKGGQQTAGAYRITRTGGDLRLVLADDFATDDGPDLHVVLSPTGAEAASSENATAGGEARVITLLDTLSGAQQYDLPDDLDLRPFQSVLIHCVQYSHLYGAAPL